MSRGHRRWWRGLASSPSGALALATPAGSGGPEPRPSSGVALGEQAPPSATVDQVRLRALVELAREGDVEAFGQLYDHYMPGVFKFVFYRTGSQTLAEDLTSETFLRGLRGIANFRWQGKDFGAWLTTIARNLITDHYKSSRSRLEIVSESAAADDGRDSTRRVASAESDVMTLVTNQLLFDAVNGLPAEQRDCVILRFVQGLTIAETAEVLERSEGAVKQLQLRAVRALAKLMPADIR